ncbi:MAG TPA: hydroxymethylpyrimidine/phosphomethylpyrimidine kinase [Polyangia bacterium]|nr:hydroxymethylpyrimidine/phosphomethylpyrimidine kinase [Polyangia bacterium]
MSGNGNVWEEVAANDTARVVREVPQQATVLVVAGLDPSGGAGLLADARVVMQHGFHPAGVATALTEQDSLLCSWMHPVNAEVVSNQLARLIDDFEIRGVKVGMLANPAVALAVAQALRRLVDSNVPIVVDPVLRATRGVPLFEGTPQSALQRILELATVVTPNLDELSQLTARHIDDPDAMKDGARRLRARGPRAVLAKGGHLHGDPIDVLVDKEGDLSIKGARIEGPTPHGTGCALSTEIACRLAIGTPLREAVLASCERVRTRIAEARTVGRGRPFLG